MLILGIIISFSLSGLRYLQELNLALPSADSPLEQQELASTIVDRKGVELYRVIGEYARDPVKIEDIPEHVKWSFIAAEDMDFYTHQGFDPNAILRCSFYALDQSQGSFCGGSTITQQLVKQTVFGGEINIERKLKEILLATKVEAAHSKEEILEQYLTLVPMGGNIYGLTYGARFYFGKEPKDLTLAESTLLAAIIQNPTQLSPTVGLPDPEVARTKVLRRQNYILDQLELNRDKINSETRLSKSDEELDDVITQDMIDAARVEVLVFKSPKATDKKAGHFVDYVQYLLTTRPYNQGVPFTAEQIATGGYTIQTTLDYELQLTAEQSVADAVRQNAGYGVNNAALLTLQPSTGEIITMVGSKSYNETSQGCDAENRHCLFDPQVNIMTTKQSPGSSTKPFGYYEAYRQGALFTGSLLPDIPIEIGGGYSLKNWNGTFFGVSTLTNAGTMLCMSRNLPSVIVLERIGIQRFVDVMNEFGYSTYPKEGSYGHSIILGGSDVIGVEHAQAYGVFANNGNFVQHEVIKKITDAHGNVIFEYAPQARQVAEPQASYMINQSLRNCAGSSWDGRSVGAKTGTSQDNIDNWVVIYSPDFVSVAWVGNNNNQPMSYNAYGETTVMPWLKNYMRQVGDSEYFAARSDFVHPEGVVDGGGGIYNGYQTGITSGVMKSDLYPLTDVIYRTLAVCANNPGLLAKQSDIDSGNVTYRSFPYYIMPVAHWQYQLDGYMFRSGLPNGGPTAYCP